MLLVVVPGVEVDAYAWCQRAFRRKSYRVAWTQALYRLSSLAGTVGSEFVHPPNSRQHEQSLLNMINNNTYQLQQKTKHHHTLEHFVQQ